MTFKVVIPARYQSSRLEGKPLLDIGGIPMIIHVVKQSLKSKANDVVVATDDQKIFDIVEKFGYKAIMTNINHKSGTDRAVEVVNLMDWSDHEIVVKLNKIMQDVVSSNAEWASDHLLIIMNEILHLAAEVKKQDPESKVP